MRLHDLLTPCDTGKIASAPSLLRRTYVRTIFPECMGHHLIPLVSRQAWTGYSVYDPSGFCRVFQCFRQIASAAQARADLLLRRPRKQYIIDFIERNGGRKCKEGENPASVRWKSISLVCADHDLAIFADMLYVIGEGATVHSSIDWSSVWLRSQGTNRN